MDSPLSLSQSTRSPLARLVLFMVCRAIAGICIAGTHYYTVDLPQQKATTPENGVGWGYKCDICKANCAGVKDPWNCLKGYDLMR